MAHYYTNQLSTVFFSKRNLISEGILTLVPLPKKKCQICPLSRKFEFPAFTVNNLFKFSAQGRDLAPFFGYGQNTF